MFSLLRLLVIIFIIYLLYQSARWIFSQKEKRDQVKNEKHSKKITGEDLVEDPHCHMYVPMSKAMEKKIGDKMQYFCSDSCYKAYKKEMEKNEEAL